MSGSARGTAGPYRGVLFDLDGTLVDTLDLILSSYRHTMEIHLGRVPPDEKWLRTMGTPVRSQLRDFARSPEELEAMFRTYVAHNAANHASLIRPFPTMREAVRALHGSGLLLGVVTSKLREPALRELRTCRLGEFFEAVVAADDVDRPKPDPEPVVRLLSMLELRPDEALLVGDSVHDIQAGRAAGVHTAAALWGPFDRRALGPARPDFWLEHIQTLLTLLAVDGRRPDG